MREICEKFARNNLSTLSVDKVFLPKVKKKSLWPQIIKGEYTIEWHYDVQTLLQHYQGIFTNAALERLTGIHQKQLWNYANGISKPRPAARQKIQNALHALGAELMALSL